MGSYVPDSFPGYDPSGWKVRTDLARAKQLLGEAGYPNGLEIVLNYSAAVPEAEEIATLVKSSLAKVGLQAKLNKLPAAQYTEGLFGKRLAFFIDIDVPLVPDAGYASWLWFHSGSAINYIGYNNPRVTKMIDAALAEPSQAARLKAYKALQSTISAENVWLYLAFPGEHVAMRQNIVGYTWVPLGLVKWSDLRFK